MTRRLAATLTVVLTLAACDQKTDTPPDTTNTTDESTDTHQTSPPDTSPQGDPEPTSSPYHSTVDLERLHESGRLDDLQTTVVTTPDDPAYGTEKRFEGWPLDALLAAHADMPDDPTGYVAQFIATDGYRATVPLDELPAGEGVVAFRDLGAPDGRDWASFDHGDQSTTPAPFYLVWPSASPSADHRPWSYKLAKIGIARAEDLWGDAVPPDDAGLDAGFAVFRAHCMKCHSVNLSGGSVGPELNVPMNVTEYWKTEQLPQYIRHPSSFRADATMPAMEGNLSEEDMAALLDYLRGMREAKICETREECQEARREH